ncbi:MAG: hypothetical protein M1167_00840, partial [Chloroflexi bacterium]|nr:hypothetical protein [Chloroflexota bacterium]
MIVWAFESIEAWALLFELGYCLVPIENLTVMAAAIVILPLYNGRSKNMFVCWYVGVADASH